LVALKLIPKVGKSPSEVASLREELKIQARLPMHPNVVHMLASAETERELLAVTEYVGGGELCGELKRHPKGFLEEDRVRAIAVDVLSALHFLHKNRVLHRDVKPQNILLDEKGTSSNPFHSKFCSYLY